ncbi:nucleic acid binding protein [Phlox virus B]|uniref:Nucleic acid binding protein n=1 Tax=Phlox virus B TaxID=475777 RepID=A8II70_9VIRU|nr:nucleic acid binding protein [Phlox virus B]ABW05097.1 nucleic acid binding protein [Phlox virus B]
MSWCDNSFLCGLVKIGLCNRGVPHGIASDLVNQIVSEFEEGARRCRFLKEFHNGTSRSAAKRRARYLGVCVKCGKLLHEGACPRGQTKAQWERYMVVKEGSISFLSENSKIFRPGSKADDACSALLEKYTYALGNLSLKDPNNV